jgi:hypothetical protein
MPFMIFKHNPSLALFGGKTFSFFVAVLVETWEIGAGSPVLEHAELWELPAPGTPTQEILEDWEITAPTFEESGQFSFSEDWELPDPPTFEESGQFSFSEDWEFPALPTFGDSAQFSFFEDWENASPPATAPGGVTPDFWLLADDLG